MPKDPHLNGSSNGSFDDPVAHAAFIAEQQERFAENLKEAEEQGVDFTAEYAALMADSRLPEAFDDVLRVVTFRRIDSGAVTELAHNHKLRASYEFSLTHKYYGSLRIPRIVRTEIHTGKQRRDALVELMINRLTRTADPYIDITPELIDRAGVLRTEALKTGREALSYTSAVTIVTTDLEDIGDLVTATGRSNIAVRLPG